MDYMKFNCFDLAAQNTELHATLGRLQVLSEELNRTITSLDPQIKNYEGLQNQLAAAGTATADIALRILAAHSALDQIIDLYYAAENKVNLTVEDLPTGIKNTQKEGGRSYIGNAKLETSSINSGNLIMEDWLAELVYRYGK